MMNARRIAPLIIVVLAGLVLALPVRGQSCGIIVNNADATQCITVTGSSALNTLIANIGPRFVVEYANGIQYISVGPISSDLQTLLGQVNTRIVIQYANANRTHTFAYPVGLVGDTTPPQINTVAVEPLGSGSVKISWFTDEFATSTLKYGTQSGAYTQTITDPLYYKLHELSLTGLTPGTTYYYRVRSTDRSGNMAESQERSFTATISVYLPLIKK